MAAQNRQVDAPGALLDETLLERAAEVFKSLAHPARLRIAELLATGPLPVNVISARLGIAPNLASTYLNRMKLNAILRSRKSGRTVVYEINDSDLASCIARVLAFTIRRTPHEIS